jgi:hypothetical protein
VPEDLQRGLGQVCSAAAGTIDHCVIDSLNRHCRQLAAPVHLGQLIAKRLS